MRNDTVPPADQSQGLSTTEECELIKLLIDFPQDFRAAYDTELKAIRGLLDSSELEGSQVDEFYQGGKLTSMDLDLIRKLLKTKPAKRDVLFYNKILFIRERLHDGNNESSREAMECIDSFLQSNMESFKGYIGDQCSTATLDGLESLTRLLFLNDNQLAGLGIEAPGALPFIHGAVARYLLRCFVAKILENKAELKVRLLSVNDCTARYFIRVANPEKAYFISYECLKFCKAQGDTDQAMDSALQLIEEEMIKYKRSIALTRAFLWMGDCNMPGTAELVTKWKQQCGVDTPERNENNLIILARLLMNPTATLDEKFSDNLSAIFKMIYFNDVIKKIYAQSNINNQVEIGHDHRPSHTLPCISPQHVDSLPVCFIRFIVETFCLDVELSSAGIHSAAATINGSQHNSQGDARSRCNPVNQLHQAWLSYRAAEVPGRQQTFFQAQAAQAQAAQALLKLTAKGKGVPRTSQANGKRKRGPKDFSI